MTPTTNPTPPQPEMPKPDFTGFLHGWRVTDGTTAIERYAQQQRERAEKAETENARLREALTFLKTDHLRLLARYFDSMYAGDPNTEVQDDLREWADKIDQALHGQPEERKETTDD